MNDTGLIQACRRACQNVKAALSFRFEGATPDDRWRSYLLYRDSGGQHVSTDDVDILKLVKAGPAGIARVAAAQDLRKEAAAIFTDALTANPRLSFGEATALLGVEPLNRRVNRAIKSTYREVKEKLSESHACQVDPLAVAKAEVDLEQLEAIVNAALAENGKTFGKRRTEHFCTHFRRAAARESKQRE